MSKLAQYLREHISGEVYDDNYTRNWFSTDGSILSEKPKLVIYPRRVSDVAKLNRFLWKLSEKGAKLGLTPRGAGSDQAGAAIGSGVSLVFPAHMNKILELDTSKNLVVVQPGINYAALQQTLHTHGKFLPPYPSSIDFATIGGSVANNAAGEKSVKYGSILNYVKKLKVILSNGDLIETGPISKKDLKKKKSLNTFEGEIYRQVDNLVTSNSELVTRLGGVRITKNSAGYNLQLVKLKSGGIDLTPLFVGSQGTLGVITEITLKVENYNPNPGLILAEFHDVASADRAVFKLKKLEPSALEMVDGNLIEFVKKRHANHIDKLISSLETPAIVLLCEFDDVSKLKLKGKISKATKIINEYTKFFRVSTDSDEQDEIWKIRHSAALVLSHRTETGASAVPMIEDGCVPPNKLPQLISGIYDLFNKYRLDSAIWGHAGDANLHLEPFLDLSNPNDRRKVFKLLNEYNRLVISLGGTITGEHGEGRIRAPYLKMQFGDDIYNLFTKLKGIFDPMDIMNPGVKLGVKEVDNISLLRKEFNTQHYVSHLPRS